MYDGSDNLIMRFAYADARMPVAMEMGGSTYYLIPDQVGSIRLVVDATGNTIKKIDYDSFGNILNDSDPAFSVPFGFAGGLHDRDTGLVRFGFRDYDPDTGRWTAKDPILFAGGDTDLYGYCLSDPVNFVDPNGLEVSGALVGAISGGILGAVSGAKEGGVAGAIAGGITGAITGAIIGAATEPVTGGKVGGIAGAIAGHLVGAFIGEMFGPSSIDPSEEGPMIYRAPVPPMPIDNPC